MNPIHARVILSNLSNSSNWMKIFFFLKTLARKPNTLTVSVFFTVCSPGFGRDGSNNCVECQDGFYSGSGENACLSCGDNEDTNGEVSSMSKDACSE